MLEELARLGLAEDTLTLFTSDNGSRADELGGSNGALRGRKAEAWEGGMRLPLIAHWPGVIPPGTTCGELTSAIDLLPTIAAVAGAALPEDRVIDGFDIGPLLRDPTAASPRDEFLYFVGGQLEGIRDERWKVRLVDTDGTWVPQLFDLREDVGETTNVADAHPEVAQRLLDRMDAARRDLGDSLTGVEGSGRRPVGYVEDAAPLTEYDPKHPYVVAAYDLSERG